MGSTVDKFIDRAYQFADFCNSASARELNLESCTTAVSSTQINGMAKRFVKAMKEDYIAFMPKPDVGVALKIFAAAFTHYNETYPCSALGTYLPENTGNSGHR